MASYVSLDTIHRASTGTVPPASWGDQVNDDVAFLYGDTAWTQVSAFSGTWVNFGAPYNTAAYRKIGTVVFLRGLIKSGTINTAAFTLPAGYRPASGTSLFAVNAGGAFGQLSIPTNGIVTPAIGSTASFSLECCFDTI